MVRIKPKERLFPLTRSRNGADNKRPMECTLALVADAANHEEGGKLNILGAFDQVYTDEFPYVLPQMFVVVRLIANPSEFGRTKELELVLHDQDGIMVGQPIKAKGKVPTPTGGGQARMELILRMNNVPFEKPGDYAISVLVSGDQKASIRLGVLKRPAKKKRKGKSSGK